MKTSKDFASCPFCGSDPTVSDPEWTDGYRFLTLTIHCCCDVVVSLPRNYARNVAAKENKKLLLEKALPKWNTRHRPEEESLNEQLEVASNALQSLACLGNGDCYGNSHGNVIAQEAIAKIATIRSQW